MRFLNENEDENDNDNFLIDVNVRKFIVNWA